MPNSDIIKVFCPRCGFGFEAANSNTGKTAGRIGGIAAGAALGAKVGIAMGPLGAVAGTVPGAILGAVFGASAGNALERPQCPQCGQTFDMVKPKAQWQSSGPTGYKLYSYEELADLSNLIIELMKIDDDFTIALKGSTSIATVISEVTNRYGIEIQPGSAINDYLNALENKNISEMATIIRAMATRLSQLQCKRGRGELLSIFFTGSCRGNDVANGDDVPF
jgi:ribosomal protein S27AE